jgi:hypothetical protein
MKVVTKLHHVPIYDLRLLVGVYHKPEAINARLRPMFGEIDVGVNIASCLWRNANFGLVFQRDELCHEVIGHEVFHATHRMLRYIGAKFKRGSNEPHAYLCGYLTQLVYSDMSAWGETVLPMNGFKLRGYPRPDRHNDE